MQDDSTKFYLYFLSHPSSETIYIGQTAYPKGRLLSHISDSKRGRKGYRFNWIRSLLNKGLAPELKVLFSVETKDFANFWEIILIDLCKKLEIKTCNTTKGGEGTYGWKMPEEVKEKIRKANTGHKMSKEQYDHVVHANRTIKRNFSPEWRKIASKRKQKARKLSLLLLQDIIKANKEEKISLTSIEKQIGIRRHTLRYAIRHYKNNDIEYIKGLIENNKFYKKINIVRDGYYRGLPNSLIKEIIKEYKEGNMIKNIAKKYNISEQTILKYRKIQGAF